MSVSNTKPINDVLKDEAAFADARYEKYEHDLEINQRNLSHFAHPTDFSNWQARMGQQLGDVRGKSLLDLGCGVGKHSVFFAKLGAHVTSIDISTRGIGNLKKRARYNNVRIDAQIMACPTSFPDENFELIFGVGIVHHVGLTECLNEVKRLLKPGGRAVFFEPMGNCRTIESAKMWLHGRLAHRLDLEPITDHETVLKWTDIKSFETEFSQLRMYPYELLHRVRKFTPKTIWDTLCVADYYLLKFMPPLYYVAGSVVISLVK